MSQKISSAIIESMRGIGEKVADRGFFEIDLMSSKILWINEFALKKAGMSVAQAQALTMYDLVPEDFHDSLSNFMADASKHRTAKFYIWPFRVGYGDYVWWYFAKVRSEHPVHWFRAELLGQTKNGGQEYASMCAAMNTVNSYNDLFNKLTDFQELTKGSMEILDNKYDELKGEQQALKEQVAGAVAAANHAANAALAVAGSMTAFKADIQNEIANLTTEILRLISTDVIHDARIASFEKHIKETTQTAVNAITVSAANAGKAITVQAKKAGDGLSRRVTIPIGAIAAIMTILQWVINHWPR